MLEAQSRLTDSLTGSWLCPPDLKDLASQSLGLLKNCLFDPRFPALFCMDVYGSIIGMFELNNLGEPLLLPSTHHEAHSRARTASIVHGWAMMACSSWPSRMQRMRFGRCPGPCWGGGGGGGGGGIQKPPAAYVMFRAEQCALSGWYMFVFDGVTKNICRRHI